MRYREYRSYESYLRHQTRLRCSRGKRKMCLKRRPQRIRTFREIFESLRLVPRGKRSGPTQRKFAEMVKCLCVGARYGEEVKAARKVFSKASIGIDLLPYDDLVIEMNMHELEFDDNSFDLIYTNAIDHCWDVKKCFSEFRRVLKPQGIVVVDHCFDIYPHLKLKSSSFCFLNLDELIEISQMELIKYRKIPEDQMKLLKVTDRIILRGR